jgi:triacylglycerol lipase
MGGLDARYYISSLGRGEKVACLCTFNTPHRGTALADRFIEQMPLVNRPLASLLDLYSRSLRKEKDADTFEAVRELSRSACAAFNEANPDDERVYYRSYASRIDGSFPVRRKAALWKILYEREGENDGLVSVTSARWGDFRGIVGAESGLSISHDDLHDLRRFVNAPPFDAPRFFAEVVAELALLGY